MLVVKARISTLKRRYALLVNYEQGIFYPGGKLLWH